MSLPLVGAANLVFSHIAAFEVFHLDLILVLSNLMRSLGLV